MPRSGITREQVEADFAVWGIPVAVRKTPPKRGGPEHSFHSACADLLALLIGPAGKINKLGVTWRSFDQGQKRARKGKNGKWINPEGAKAKRRGVRAGVSDMMVQWEPHELAWPELKVIGRDTSDAQDEFHAVQRHYGARTVVIWNNQGVGALEQFLRKSGCPLLRRIHT
jgi:hypothetical protein